MKKFLLLPLVLCLTACFTSYKVKRNDGTELSVFSFREFPDGIHINYESAQGSKLQVDAGKVQNGGSPLEDLVSRAIVQQLLPTVVTPTPAVPLEQQDE